MSASASAASVAVFSSAMLSSVLVSVPVFSPVLSDIVEWVEETWEAGHALCFVRRGLVRPGHGARGTTLARACGMFTLHSLRSCAWRISPVDPGTVSEAADNGEEARRVARKQVSDASDRGQPATTVSLRAMEGVATDATRTVGSTADAT